MPFGKYRGWLVRDLPRDYLEWLCTCDLREPLRSAVADESTRRRLDARTTKAPGPDPRIVEDVIAAGQRALARRHHPDTGGTHEGMLAVRAATDWLLERAKELRCLR